MNPLNPTAWGQPVWEWSIIDAVQCVFLAIMAGVLIWAVRKIGNAIAEAITGVRDPMLVVVKDVEEIHRLMAVMWKRIEAIEGREGPARESGQHSEVVRDWLGKAWQNIVKIEARLDAIEKGEPPPPGTRPTDPPLP
jgi:hypothetical protein